jgi:hypothetical protein
LRVTTIVGPVETAAPLPPAHKKRRFMTKTDFDCLYEECLSALKEYTEVASSLCAMLAEGSERALSLHELAAVTAQRSLENHLYSAYFSLRIRLLMAANARYGKML